MAVNSEVSNDETSEEEAVIPKVKRVLRRKPTFAARLQKEKGNALLEVSMRLSMELTHEVTTLKEMGMINPFRIKDSFKEAKEELNLFDFYIEVYP